jgi:hypothetical protein
MPVFGEVLLTYDQPLKLQGIPPILGNGGDLPLSATQPNENEIYLVWGSQPPPGFVLEVPPWSPTIRGLNGEWASGGPIVIGGGGAGTLPTLLGIQSATKFGPNAVRFILTGSWTVESSEAILLNGVLATSASNVGTDIVEFVYADVVAINDVWSVGSGVLGGEAWQTGMYSSASDKWLGPASGRVE